MKSLFPVPKGVEGGRPVNLIFWFSMDLMIYETQQVLLLNPEEAPPDTSFCVMEVSVYRIA